MQVQDLGRGPCPCLQKRQIGLTGGSRNLNRLAQACGIIGCLVACTWYGFSVFYAANAPNADDFDFFLAFLDQWTSTSKWPAKLQLLFSRHNEHLVIVGRLAALAQWSLTGSIDFKALIVAGNLGLLLVPFLLISGSKIRQDYKFILVMPVILIFFQPRFAEATQWATAVWQFSAVLVLALVAFVTGAREGARYFSACVAASCAAVLAFGSGILVPLVLVVVLLVNRRGKIAAFWACCCLIFLLIDWFVRAEGSRIPFSLEINALRVLDYALSLIGSAFSSGRHDQALVCGGVLTVLGIFSLAVSCRKNFVLQAYLSFLFLSAFAAALPRSRLPLSTAYATSRYTLVSILICATIYLLIAEILDQRACRRAWIALSYICAFTFFVLSYRHHFNELVIRSQLPKDSLVRWQVAQTGLLYPNQKRAEQIMQSAVNKGLFKPRLVCLDALRSMPAKPFIPAKLGRGMRVAVENFLDTKDWLLVDGFAVASLKDEMERTQFLVLQSNALTYYFKAQLRMRPDVTALFMRQKRTKSSIDNSGFFVLLNKQDLAPGDYTAHLMVIQGHKTYVRRIKQSLGVGTS